MSTEVLIDRFDGGMVRDASSYLPNEVADLYGFWHINGDLETMKGPLAIMAAADGLTWSNDRSETIAYSHDPYVRADGVTCLLMRTATGMWIAVPDIDFDRPMVAGELAGLWDLKDSTDSCFDAARTYEFTNHGTQIKHLWSSRCRSFTNGAYLSMSQAVSGGICNLGAGERTVEAWIRCTGASGGSQYTIFSTLTTAATRRGYLFEVTSGGNIMAWIIENIGAADKYCSAYGTTNILAPGYANYQDWIHVAFTYNSATGAILIYINGVEDTTIVGGGTDVNANTDGAGDLSIGATLFPTAINPFEGEIRTVSVWHYKLAAETLVAHHDAELGAYDETSAMNRTLYPVQWRFYPIFSDTVVANATYEPIALYRARSKACGESVVQKDVNAYFASDDPGDQDYLMAWRGMLIAKGFVQWENNVRGGRYLLSGTPYTWKSGDIMPGDTLYIQRGLASDQWQTTGHIIKWTQPNRVVVCDTGYDTTGQGVGGLNTCKYAIVRTHRPGVQPGTVCYAAVGAVTGLTGTFSYMWRYGNSKTGKWGKFSDPSSDVACTGADANKKITISRTSGVLPEAWQVQPDDWGVDRFELYRQTIDASGNRGPWYLCTDPQITEYFNLIQYTVPTGETTSFWNRKDLPASFTDDTVANGAALTDSAVVYYDRPGIMSNIREHNLRLYGIRHQKQVLSAQDNREYMPDAELISIAPTQSEYQGFTIAIGSSLGEPVTAYIPELGSYSTTGVTGANMLVFTKTRAVRIYTGYKISQFTMAEAFAMGCIGCLVNASGLLIWNNGDYIVALPAGSNQPAVISRKLWPYGIRQYVTASDIDGCLKTWKAWHWRGWYLLTGSLSSTTPNTTWCFHIESGTWTSYAYGFNDFCEWERPGAPGYVLTGSKVSGFEISTLGVYALWENAALYKFGVTTAPRRSDDPRRRYAEQVLSAVRTAWLAPVGGNVTVAITPYVNGDTTNAAASAVNLTVPLVAAEVGARVLVDAGEPACSGWLFQVKLAGAAQTKRTRLEEITLEIEEKGKAQAT